MKELVSNLLKELKIKSANVDIDARKVLINRINGNYEFLSFNLFNNNLIDDFFILSPTFLMENDIKVKDLENLKQEIRTFAAHCNCVREYHTYFHYKED